MIPNLAIVRIQSPYWRGFRIWIPLFLLWIPALLLSPLILLVIFAACLAWRISPFAAIAIFWGLLASLPGTDVRVAAQGSHVTVRIL
jgi:hypothetical protein